jgi:hypothetical protein
MVERYQKVHMVADSWDGPRAGVADFNGIPHVYQSVFDDERDEWSDLCLLRPIDEDTFQLVMEDWQIWLRWLDAFHAGRTSQDTHPALPEDRTRHDQLTELLSSRLSIDPATAVRARSEFELDPSGGYKVRWSLLEDRNQGSRPAKAG